MDIKNASLSVKILIYGVIGAIILLLLVLLWPNPCDSGHTWESNSNAIKDDNCKKNEICSVCGETRTILSHKWTGATCKKPGVCSRCGEVGDTTYHEYAFGKCKFCGESESFYTFTSDDNDDDFWFAVTSAQNLVKKELKAPSTAKFSYDDEEYIVKKNGLDWKVSGYVDAQNGFGASIRTYWTAIFTMGDTSGSMYTVSNHIVTFS